MMFERILVAIDGSDARHAAIDTAAGLAALTGGSVRVLHVDPADVVLDTVVGLEDDRDAHKIVDDAVAVMRRAGVQADGELLDGLTPDVPDAVTAAARRFGADLIVLGPHHRSGLAARFAARVSDAVAHHSEVPVLLTPGRR